MKKYVILIEDKVHTKEHSDQLRIYIDKVQQAKGIDRKDIYPIYYKTSDQSNVGNVHAAGYKIFTREDMLKILKNGEAAGIDDSIFKAYYDYLSNFNSRIQSYKELPGDQWNDNYPWTGFYTELQNQFGSTWGEWGYVPNPSGGFLGFWWFFEEDSNCEQYLQLEHDKLCFKIIVHDKEKRRPLRDNWCQALLKATENEEFNEFKIQKPVRFGNGDYMTVAVLVSDYRIYTDGKIDVVKTLKILKTAENVLKIARSNCLRSMADLDGNK